jgi:hypothetical protein
MTSNCERLKAIEKALPYWPVQLVEDVTWLVQQVRTWQTFAARVVELGDLIPAENKSLTKAYNLLFAPPVERPSGS